MVGMVMIAALRARHRAWMTALVLVVPALAILGWQAWPGSSYDGWSARSATSPEVAGTPVPGWPLVTAVDRDGQGGRVLVVTSRQAVAVPDPWLYWVPDTPPTAGAALPSNAVLLGRLDARTSRYPLPTGTGAAVLYSLGHEAVVTAWSLAAEGAR